MYRTYTLEGNDGLMAELKSMHGKMAEMRGCPKHSLHVLSV